MSTELFTDANKLAKRRNLLVYLCAAVYFASYITRLNYSAVLVEMIAAEGYTKTAASAALTGLFITYGVGQIISGLLGDKFKPELVIFSGLLLTSSMNFAVPAVSSTVLLTILWSINGFAQALMWPPIVKILIGRLSGEEYRKKIVYVGWGGNIGTILIYLLAPVSISVGGWRAIFYFCGGAALLMAFVWLFLFKRLSVPIIAQDITPESKAVPEKTKMPIAAIAFLIIIMLAVAAQGLLRDGITTWMPTYISEQFDVSSSISILTGVALPIFGILISAVTSYIYRHWITNVSLCAAVFFAVCVAGNIILCFSFDTSSALSVVLLTLINGATHGINVLFTCMAVQNYEKYGRSSSIAGIINSSTYVGSALSTYGGALVTSLFGWGGMMIAWCISGAFGLLTSLFSATLLKKFK